MKRYLSKENDFDSDRANIILNNSSRKIAGQYIYKMLKKIGDFRRTIKVEIEKTGDEDNIFSETMCAIDKNNNKFFFSLNNLYAGPRHFLNFLGEEYNYVLAKEESEKHYKLYNSLGDETDSFAEIYKYGNNILYILNSYRLPVTKYVYINTKNNEVQYTVSVCREESLTEKEVRKLVKQNSINNPKSLLDYLDNFRNIKDINQFDYISISSEKNYEEVGKIDIKDGQITKFYLREKYNNLELNMNIDTDSKDKELKVESIRKEKIEIDELTQNLQTTYKKGMELFKIMKKNC